MFMCATSSSQLNRGPKINENGRFSTDKPKRLGCECVQLQNEARQVKASEGKKKEGPASARSRPDEGGATRKPEPPLLGHETRCETKRRPLVGPGVPPAPTAEQAGGPKQAAHGWQRTAP